MYTGPNIIEDGLVFGYDADDRSSRFYKGEPTTNYIYHQNPRIDTSYAPYNMASFGGTMAQNHPGALTVYNSLGGDISWYINTGVTDWTNTRHAYWVYDETLKKPVVVMNNVADTWQAKSFATGMNAWSTYGYGVGTKYTISWLQWTSNINRAVVAGLYTQNSSGGYNFWDGDTLNSPTSFNTLPYTWQRVYHTFTVTNNWDQTREYNNIFMYGMYYGSGTLKISDVQLEIKDHPTQYNNTFSRAADQTLYNLKNKTAIDLTNVSFDATAHPVFDGTDDVIAVSLVDTVEETLEIVYKMNTTGQPFGPLFREDWNVRIFPTHIIIINSNGTYYQSNTFIDDTNLKHITITWSGTSLKFYVNGIQLGSTVTMNGVMGTGPFVYKNGYQCGGSSCLFVNCTVKLLKQYNKALTSSEVQQNFNSYKYRFNI